MSEATGLGPLELAALQATDRLSGPEHGFIRSSDVLQGLEHEGFGPAYFYPVLQDLAVPWKRHLPLLEFQGNFGSPGNDPAADPQYTEVQLSAIGRLALRAENGDVGSVPLGLIDGNAYCGGRVPPFAPQRILDALSLLTDRGGACTDAELVDVAGPPSVPTRAFIIGDTARLASGRPTTMQMSCRIESSLRDGTEMVDITGYPLGADLDQIVQSIADRVRWPEPRRGGGSDLVADVQNHSSERSGTLVRVQPRPGVEIQAVEAWLRTIWPVTIEVDWCLPVPMSVRLRSAAPAAHAGADGLSELRALI